MPISIYFITLGFFHSAYKHPKLTWLFTSLPITITPKLNVSSKSRALSATCCYDISNSAPYRPQWVLKNIGGKEEREGEKKVVS